MEASQVQQYASSAAATSAISHSHNHHRLPSATDLKLATSGFAAQDQYAKKSSLSDNKSAGASASSAQEEARKRGQAGQPESTINETIQILLDHHIVENRRLLNESWINLDKIADYCDANYLQSDRKDLALEETKNYTTRSLASVANQIHSFSANLLTLFDLQLNALNELETRSNGLSSSIRFHEERAFRRDIGKLTKPKLLPCAGAPKVLRPLYPERYAAKKRRTNYYSISGSGSSSGGGQKGLGISGSDSVSESSTSIDYSLLDDIGQAHRIYERRGMTLMSRSMAIYSTGGGAGAGAAANGGYGTGLINSAGMIDSSGLIASGHSLATGGAAGLSTSAGSAAAAAGGGLAGQRHWMPSVKSATLRPSKSSNLSAALSSSVYSPLEGAMSSSSATSSSSRTPAPTVRPPTPPLGSVAHGSATMSRFSSLSRGAGGVNSGSKDYRSLGPLVVAPPQLPNNYQSTSALQLQKQQQQQQQLQQSSTLQLTKKSSSAQPQAKTPQTLQTSACEPSQAYQQRRSPSTNPFLDDLQGASGSQPSTVGGASGAHQTAKGAHPNAGAPSHWIPSSYLQKVVALYDYNADKDDELTFKESSVIYVTAKNDDGWWEGVMNGITGLFPGNYVEPSP